MASSEAVHDLFDVLEEDQDELKYTTKELNRYFEQSHLQSMMDEEDLIDDDSFDVQVRLDCFETWARAFLSSPWKKETKFSHNTSATYRPTIRTNQSPPQP